MVRRLTSSGAVKLWILGAGVTLPVCAIQRADAAVTMVLLAAFLIGFGVSAVARYRRVSAWTRGAVPAEYRDGATAWATIRGYYRVSERFGSAPVMRFQVTVHAPEGEFVSKMEVLAPGAPLDEFALGQTYPVRYLPEALSWVAYDTTAAADSLPAYPSETVGDLPDEAGEPSGLVISEVPADEPRFNNYPSSPQERPAP